MTFTQSPSVSNNPKIPTYYLIFAVPQYNVEFIFIAVSCFHIWSLNTPPFLKRSYRLFVPEFNVWALRTQYSAVQDVLRCGAPLAFPSPSSSSCPHNTAACNLLQSALSNVQWNLQVHCKSVGRSAVHKGHMHKLLILASNIQCVMWNINSAVDSDYNAIPAVDKRKALQCSAPLTLILEHR